MRTPLISILILLLWAVGILNAQEIRVGTLNTYLLFNPARPTQSRISSGFPANAEDYSRKLSNLAGMTEGLDVVAVQELGDREALAELAAAAGKDYRFSQGKDTYTGQDVGFLIRAGGPWNVVQAGRVGQLDRALSKHLAVTLQHAPSSRRLLILNVHLVRPIGKNADKHRHQLAALQQWAQEVHRLHPEMPVVILGDFNNNTCTPSSSLVGPAFREVGEINGWQPTHLRRQMFDRILYQLPLQASEVAVVRPPYGPRPNDTLKTLWSDHFLVKCVISW